MVIPDINLLVYAYDEDSPFHQKASLWLSILLNGQQEVGFPLVSLLGFVRLVSNPKIFENPISPEKACDTVQSWLATPSAALLEPGVKHFQVLHELLVRSQATSTLTTDTHIAALALEHKGVVHTNDNDFSRFKGIKFYNPLSN